jgi:aminobenzoyl-glutamate utilization protein B
MTQCRYERRWVSNRAPACPITRCRGSPRIADGGRRAAWGEAAAVARETTNLGWRRWAPFLRNATAIAPEEAERILRATCRPPGQFHLDDYTDMCWHAPAARLWRARLARPRRFRYPWVANALGGIALTIDPMVVTAARPWR